MTFDPYHITIEKVEEIFDTDKKARDFFEQVRWGGHPQCPRCGSFKAYPNGCGTRYKCGECKKKYSVGLNSLLNYTHISLRSWLIGVCLYQKSRGQILTIALAAILQIRDDTAFMMKNRLVSIFSPIIRTPEKSGYDIFREACMNFFILKDKYVSKKDFSKSSYHISGILNLSDKATYDRLVLYTKIRMFYCKYITTSFLSPEEILNEAFIRLTELSESDRTDGQIIVKTINRTISKLWYDYQKANPILYKKYLEYGKEWKQEARQRLRAYYLTQLENTRLERVGAEKITVQDMRLDKSTAQEIRGRVKKKRMSRATYDL